MCHVKLRMRWAAALAVLVTLSLSTSLSTWAAPPGSGGGGGVPPGRIFYTWNTALQQSSGGTYLGFWSMNAEGSGKQLLPYQPAFYNYAQLSHLSHQGHRWFLELRSSPPPGHGGAVYAVRDDGDPNFTVFLVDPPDMSMNHWRWTKDDSFISICAIATITDKAGRTFTDPNALAHIYSADIAFNPDTGLPTLTTALVEVAEGERPGYLDIENHDWSPDGTEVVYGRRPNDGTATAEVIIADVVTGATRLLAEYSYDPAWSPDGTRIAYKPFNDGIHVVNPNGSGLLKITSGNGDDMPGWSPDGKHVVFERIVIKMLVVSQIDSRPRFVTPRCRSAYAAAGSEPESTSCNCNAASSSGVDRSTLGLIFAGITDTCGRGLLPARRPWNRVGDGTETARRR